jgi:hypothetical protein
MKNRIFKSLFAALLLVTVGCNDEFLETEPTAFITQEQLAAASVNNPDLLRGTISGLKQVLVELQVIMTLDKKEWIFGQICCLEMSLYHKILITGTEIL